LKTALLHTLFAILFVAALTVVGQAQDIHFAHIGHSPLNRNPGLTGVFSGDHRFIGNYRRQWANVPVDYITYSGSYDAKIYGKKNLDNFFAGGLVFNHDKAGDSGLKYISLGLNGSYTHMLSERNFLTLGVQAGAAQRSLSMEQLQFDNQYNAGSNQFDSTIGTGEANSMFSRTFADFGAGLNYHFQVPEKRTALDAGIGVFHFNEPNKSFFEESGGEDNLPARYSMYGIGTVMVAEKVDLLLHFTQSYQGPHQETFAGFGGRFHINQQRDKELAISLNLNYRLNNNDALIPVLGVRYRNWQAAFSYDLNISDFSDATAGNGGPEFSIIHVITTVKPVKTKICPIYL